MVPSRWMSTRSISQPCSCKAVGVPLTEECSSGTEMMSLVAEKVARGDTGARSGQGFYRWDEARHQRIQSRREHQLRFALKP